MAALAIGLWLHLFALAPSGCVPVPFPPHRAYEVAPMPRVVPVLRVPERQPPRIVIPPKKK